MQESVKRRAVYADLEGLPPHVVGEILYGTLVTQPRPAPPHSEVQATLSGVLVGPFRIGTGGPGGWRFMTEPELHLGEEVLVPELAGWRVERMPSLPKTAYVELAPDWVCEVLSQSTEKFDRGDKRQIYAEAGISHLWLVDPRVQILEAFELTGKRWTLFGVHQGDAVVRVAPFDAIEIHLGVLWPIDMSRAGN
jgi:Uma2 family endonuclease